MFWDKVEAGKNIYIWAGRMWFWFNPKTASMASSSTSALVAAGSLQAESTYPTTDYITHDNGVRNRSIREGPA